MSTPPSRALSAYTALIVASLSWGLATATTKYALAGFSAVDLLALETGVATLTLWSVSSVRRRARRRFRRGYLLLGLLDPLGAYVLFNLGLERTSAADAALLISFESLAVALLAAAFLREHVSRTLALGLALGIVGTGLLAVAETHRGASLVGDSLVLAGVVATAAYSVAARYLSPGADPIAVTSYQLLTAFLAAALIWFAASAHSGSRIAGASGREWIAAVSTGLLGSAVPFLLFTFAVKYLPASRTASVGNLIPVFGVAASVGILGERLSPSQFLAGLVIVASVGVAQLRVRTG